MLQKHFCVCEGSYQVMNKSTTSEMLLSEKGFHIYPLAHFSSRKRNFNFRVLSTKLRILDYPVSYDVFGKY